MTVYPPISTGTYSAYSLYAADCCCRTRGDGNRLRSGQHRADDGANLGVGLGFFGKPAGLDNHGFDAVIRFVDNLYAGGFENILKTAAAVLLFNAVNRASAPDALA